MKHEDELVNIIITKDTVLKNGIELKAKEIYENVSKYTDPKGHVFYEIEEGKTIESNNGEYLMELGFVTSEIFRLIKNISSAGDIDIDDIISLYNEIKDIQSELADTLEENKQLLERVEGLEISCQNFATFGEF